MISYLNENVARNVVRIRREMNMTQPMLAARMRVTIETVRKIESGHGAVNGWTRTRLIAALRTHWCALEMDCPLDTIPAGAGVAAPRTAKIRDLAAREAATATIRPMPVSLGGERPEGPTGHLRRQSDRAPVPGIVRHVRHSVFRVWLGNIIDLFHTRRPLAG